MNSAINHKLLGGVIHTYQRYDPKNFPSPTPPDLVSPVFHVVSNLGLANRKHRRLQDVRHTSLGRSTIK